MIEEQLQPYQTKDKKEYITLKIKKINQPQEQHSPYLIIKSSNNQSHHQNVNHQTDFAQKQQNAAFTLLKDQLTQYKQQGQVQLSNLKCQLQKNYQNMFASLKAQMQQNFDKKLTLLKAELKKQYETGIVKLNQVLSEQNQRINYEIENLQQQNLSAQNKLGQVRYQQQCNSSNPIIMHYHQENDPHGKYFSLKKQGNKLNINHTAINQWAYFISSANIKHDSITKFNVKVTRLTGNCLNFGIGTSHMIGNANYSHKDYLNLDYYGYLFENGVQKSVNIPNVYKDSIISMIVDRKEHKVSWLTNGIKVAEAVIPNHMQSQHLYLIFYFKYQNDELQLQEEE